MGAREVADNKVEFRYTAADVTSTQRYRILHSSQFKLLVAFWGIGVIFIALHMLLPTIFTFISGVTWLMVGQAGLIFVASILVLLFVIPWFNFQFTRFWRMAFVFQFNNKTLRLGVAGKTGGLVLEWSQVRKVEETPRTFVIYYEDSTKHFMLPRAAFSERSEQRFRGLVTRLMSAKSEPSAADEKAKPPQAKPEK
jgi:hypothetical protein